MEVQQGDTIEVLSNKVDRPNRRGVVERIVREEPLRLEVRWDDGHVSLFTPSGGSVRVDSPTG